MKVVGQFKDYKCVPKATSYRYVTKYKHINTGAEFYVAMIQTSPNLGSRGWKQSFATERDAALAADMKLIEIGKEPVNILKRGLR